MGGGDDVLNGGDQASGVGNEEGPGLDFEAEADASAIAIVLELALDGLADGLEVCRLLVGHAADLVAAAEVEGGHRVAEALAEAERELGDSLPHARVRPRSYVRVDAFECEVVVTGGRHDIVEEAVPDAEGGRRAADVGFLVSARTDARVEAHAHGRSGKALAVSLELGEGTAVHVEAHVHELTEAFVELLRREADLGRRDAGFESASRFVG